MSALRKQNYPDVGNSVIQVCPQVLNQTWNYGDMMDNSQTSGFNPKAPYNINCAPTYSAQLTAGNSITPIPTEYAVSPFNLGFTKPISSAFCRGSE